MSPCVGLLLLDGKVESSVDFIIKENKTLQFDDDDDDDARWDMLSILNYRYALLQLWGRLRSEMDKALESYIL